MKIILVCEQCNEPLKYVVLPDGAGKEYFLNTTCGCGGRIFVPIEIPSEMACDTAVESEEH